MNQPERNVLGVAIRMLFFQHKSARMGKPYKPSSRHDDPEYYRKAADQCIELKANPENYVTACFEQSQHKFRQGPFANMLFGPAARRWYQDHMAIRQAPPEEREARFSDIGEVDEAEEEIEPFDITTTAEVDIKFTIGQTLKSIYHLTGSFDHTTPEGMKYLRDQLRSYSSISRVLLGFPDPVIMQRYGKEAQQLILTRPDMKAAIEQLNYPVKEILQWRR